MAMASAAQCTFGCEICTESFQDDLHKKVCAIPCGHVHHEKCLERWFLTQCQQMRPTNCPKCRAPATNHQMIRLFLFDTGSDSAPASHNTNHNNTPNMIQHDPVILDESDNENTDEVIVISDSEANNSDADSSDEDVAMVVFGERNLRNNNVAFDVDFNLELPQNGQQLLDDRARRMRVLSHTLSNLNVRLDSILRRQQQQYSEMLAHHGNM